MRRFPVLLAWLVSFVLFSEERATAQNLALNKLATGTTSCNGNESPAKAVNGTVNGGLADKFCTSVAPGWLQVDLGAVQNIGSVTVRHAGAGGESTSFNTRNFNIQISTNGTAWTTPVTVTGSTASVTTHPIAAQSARYVRLNVTAATQATDANARVYELEVYAAAGQAPFGGTNGAIANGAVIQAENYDVGGAGVAYNDTTAGNTGGQYRADGVDIEACTDAGGGYNVGWIVDGEWLEYTVNATAGTYNVTARVASAGTTVGDLRVLLDGVVLGTIPVNATGGWQGYVDATLGGVTIAGGNNRVLRLESVNGGDFNVNYVRFASTGPTPTATARPRATATATSTPTPVPGAGDVVGKVTAGYQAWFAATGDGSPINAWWHWSQNWSQTPSVAQNVIHAWPDTREYANLYTTAYPNLGNGQPARLFSSFDQSTINTQVSWMKQYGIDTAALQRFNPTGGEGPVRDAITAKVRSAAEAVGVKFYIMYDVSGWTNMQSEIKNDWLNKMSVYASSPAYARQNGRPVVAIWGFGFNDGNHPWDAATCLEVVTWFKAQGVYVIGGVPREWRTGTGGSRSGFLGVYHAFNMISPWLVGAIGSVADADNLYTNVQLQDQADLNANGIAYQPCVLPGDNGQRAHGDFMWRQFYNVVRLGAQGIYISMFDEYNEGNQIAKTAEDASMSPTGTSSIFFTLDQDGTRCSSDYYLRLTGDGGRMLKKQIGLTATRPTSPQ